MLFPASGSLIKTVEFDISGRTNMWGPVPFALPNLRAGTYVLYAECAGNGVGVRTNYKAFQFRVIGTCTKPFFVGLRGSGEEAAGENRTLTGMGATTDWVYRNLRTQLGEEIDTIPREVQMQRYDAVRAGDYRYQASMEMGKRLALEQVRARISRCGTATEIVMAGYSQGAQGILEALHAMSADERSKVKGVTLFGNPRHTPAVNGDAGPNNGIGLFGVSAPVGNGVPSRMRDYCNWLDPVCGNWPSPLASKVHFAVAMAAVQSCGRTGATCTHKHYLATHADQAAEYLADRLR